MKVINLYGGPGTGKSTTAAGLFNLMKLEGMNVELVTEFAKDITWEGHLNILEDQLYILAHQNRRLHRLRDKVDYIITDSPIIMGLVYNRVIDSFKKYVFDLFNSYDNCNYWLLRTKPYSTVGRNQTEEEARKKDYEIRDLLCNVYFKSIKGDRFAPAIILNEITGD